MKGALLRRPNYFKTTSEAKRVVGGPISTSGADGCCWVLGADVVMNGEF